MVLMELKKTLLFNFINDLYDNDKIKNSFIY